MLTQAFDLLPQTIILTAQPLLLLPHLCHLRIPRQLKILTHDVECENVSHFNTLIVLLLSLVSKFGDRFLCWSSMSEAGLPNVSACHKEQFAWRLLKNSCTVPIWDSWTLIRDSRRI